MASIESTEAQSLAPKRTFNDLLANKQATNDTEVPKKRARLESPYNDDRANARRPTRQPLKEQNKLTSPAPKTDSSLKTTDIVKSYKTSTLAPTKRRPSTGAAAKLRHGPSSSRSTSLGVSGKLASDKTKHTSTEPENYPQGVASVVKRSAFDEARRRILLSELFNDEESDDDDDNDDKILSTRSRRGLQPSKSKSNAGSKGLVPASSDNQNKRKREDDNGEEFTTKPKKLCTNIATETESSSDYFTDRYPESPFKGVNLNNWASGPYKYDPSRSKWVNNELRAKHKEAQQKQRRGFAEQTRRRHEYWRAPREQQLAGPRPQPPVPVPAPAQKQQKFHAIELTRYTGPAPKLILSRKRAATQNEKENAATPSQKVKATNESIFGKGWVERKRKSAEQTRIILAQQDNNARVNRQTINQKKVTMEKANKAKIDKEEVKKAKSNHS